MINVILLEYFIVIIAKNNVRDTFNVSKYFFFFFKSYYPVGYRPKLEWVDSSGLEEEFATVGKTGSGRLVGELRIEIWIECLHEKKR